MKKLQLQPNGDAVVTETDDQGNASVWSTSAEQAEKHLPTWTDETRKMANSKGIATTPARPLSKGDVDAVRDAANEARKQRDS